MFSIYRCIRVWVLIFFGCYCLFFLIGMVWNMICFCCFFYWGGVVIEKDIGFFGLNWVMRKNGWIRMCEILDLLVRVCLYWWWGGG